MKQPVRTIKVSEGKIFVSSLEQPIRPESITYIYSISEDYERAKSKFEQANKTFLESFIEVSNLDNFYELVPSFHRLISDGIYPAPTGLVYELIEHPADPPNRRTSREGDNHWFKKVAIVSFSSDMRIEAQINKDHVLVFAEINGVIKCGKYTIVEGGYPDKLIEEIPYEGNIPVGKHWFEFADHAVPIVITHPSQFTKISSISFPSEVKKEESILYTRLQLKNAMVHASLHLSSTSAIDEYIENIVPLTDTNK